MARKISPEIVLNQQLVQRSMLYFNRKPLGVTISGYTFRCVEVFQQEVNEEFPVTPSMEFSLGFTPIITAISLQILSENTFFLMWGGRVTGKKFSYPDKDNLPGKRTDNDPKWSGELILKPFGQKVGLYIRGVRVRPKLVTPIDFRASERTDATIEFTFFLDNNAKKCFDVYGVFK